jgi:RNA-directed DNA polymerase
VERYLTRKLKLVVNHAKSCVRSTDGLEFLGYQFTGYGGQMRVSPKNFDKFKQRVRELTRRSCGISMTTRLKALGYYLRGWTGYFCLVPIKSFFVVLDQWVRRRLRSCYWKQWRKPSTRIRTLMKLGLERNEAVPFGSCSRGAWFMSRLVRIVYRVTLAFTPFRGMAYCAKSNRHRNWRAFHWFCRLSRIQLSPDLEWLSAQIKDGCNNHSFGICQIVDPVWKTS